jgi:hydrogenase-4 component B
MYAAGLLAYAAGIAGGLAGHISKSRGSAFTSFLCGLAFLGAVLEFTASLGALLSGGAPAWTLPSGVPYITCSVRLDPLSAYFNLTLSLVAAAVAIYSSGYLAHGRAAKNTGASCAWLNLLLLSLTLIFTAANVFFFLIAWELMVVSSYFLVVLDHESEEARHGGTLYILMSRSGTGAMIVGFLLLATAAGSLEFAAMHHVNLSPFLAGFAFLMLFLGFGVKAGIIPLHIWLPAAHPVAPSNISALMSGILIKAGIYGMARVFFDFFGDLPSWTGMLVLTIGVISALLGVLYALMEQDLKRLLAYSSIENIGIILMGLGSALLFRSYGHPQLAALALIAGLFHTLNHSIFKSLLFLGAGGAVHASGTRNMERMGGLIRRMPSTAFYFLIGAVAISGLPPLNGFVSEWLTYQALLNGFGATSELARVGFPIAGALLALTAALAAACFVKAFGITFLALPRTNEAGSAQEVSFAMRTGMAILAVCCILLGLGATWFLPVFAPVTQSIFGLDATKPMLAGNTFILTAGSVQSGAVSPAILGLLLAFIGTAPLLLWYFFGRKFRGLFRRVSGPTWDCGLPGLTAENEYTATAFSKPLRMIFAALFRPHREIQAEYEVSPYYPTAIRFESEIEPTFEERIYRPLRQGIFWAASRMRWMQSGSIHLYLGYIFVTLILLLLFGARG